ncbi:metal ABC transporter substrate-binding protein [Scytonema sp. NUACC26]|uniref:metal ABC transporter substrate-binding protein n=1 Tax=Scytonema sp. NUACC26 TaxID=3140176 RepID=UPI0038B26E92
MVSLGAGCNNSSTERATNSKQSPQAQEAVSTPSPQASKIKVVSTFLPIYWFTKAVAGDAADVKILVPPGTEVHEYQATPENVKEIASANVLVKNGLGLEEFLDDTIRNAQNSKLVQVDAAKGIQALDEISPVVKTHSSKEERDRVPNEKAGGKTTEHDHDHPEGNPHVWLDPVLAKQQVENIRDGLIAADPANKATYEANAAAYIKQLDSLNSEFQQTLQKTPSCTFVTFHDAYPYLAKRYNLRQVAVVEIPEDQLSPTDVQNAVKAVKQYKVKALFGEPATDNKLLTSLSKDLNLTLRPLDSLETGETEPQYYFKGMQANLETLKSACQ